QALSIQLLDRMANDRDGAGVVICQLGRSHERDSRTQFTRHASDFVVVGRNDDLVEASTLQSHLDRPGNHRLAAEHFNVLAGNALASTSCRNNGNPHAAIALCKAVMTASCCCSVIV